MCYVQFASMNSTAFISFVRSIISPNDGHFINLLIYGVVFNISLGFFDLCKLQSISYAHINFSVISMLLRFNEYHRTTSR